MGDWKKEFQTALAKFFYENAVVADVDVREFPSGYIYRNYSVYGVTDWEETTKFRFHIGQSKEIRGTAAERKKLKEAGVCVIDYDKSTKVSEFHEEEISQFQGTFTDNSTESFLAGAVTCACGMFTDVEMLYSGTVSEMIQGVLLASD